ncbi:hypothetical protein [Paenibacillus piri]|uniref:Uncharacterized protein n=1 Tax=Paenibacillus piri TaxID=2547395 RepID=A0A4R5KMU7_9BACL|nr:hypothetical protein [Paenibacillus piri]TDF96255.1 hypothetical protein E1757_17855 [Paenibacillus piri]
MERNGHKTDISQLSGRLRRCTFLVRFQGIPIAAHAGRMRTAPETDDQNCPVAAGCRSKGQRTASASVRPVPDGHSYGAVMNRRGSNNCPQAAG